MTPTERAQAIKVEHIDGIGFIDWEATLLNIVASIHAERQAARQAVWEEAIVIAEHLYTFCETAEKKRVVATIIHELRQRAKEEA